MPFLQSPLALALAVTIPAIAVLWMLRPRRSRLRIPSLLLWAASPVERQAARPWQRLRNHPLLWLQAAMALLLTAATARPFLPAAAAANQLVVLLDASGSMRAADVAPTRFDVALGQVRDLARGLGAGQRMTVVRVDEAPRVLTVDAASPRQVEDALAGQTASYGPMDLPAGLQLAGSLAPGPGEWVLVTDGGVAAPEGAALPVGATLRVLSVGTAARNVALTSLVSRAAGDTVALQAAIHNFGPQPAAGVLELRAEREPVRSMRWQADASGDAFLTLPHLPATARWYEARLTEMDIVANALPGDDAAWAAADQSRSAQSVLLVTSGNSFLERFLGVYGGIQPYRIAPADLAALMASAAAYPLVVLDRTALDAAASSTGTPANLLAIGPPSGESFTPAQIFPKQGHPLLHHVDWSEVGVASARRLALGPGWESVIDADGGPLLAVRERAGQREAVLAFDLSQSDLALRPAFPILMANLIDWLLPVRSGAPLTVAAGAPVPVEAGPLAGEVAVEAEDGTRTVLAPPWPPRAFTPPNPGVYRLVQTGPQGAQERLLTATGYHPEEADVAVRPVDLPMMQRDTGLAGLTLGVMEFWPWIAGLILLLSFAEWWVDARGR